VAVITGSSEPQVYTPPVRPPVTPKATEAVLAMQNEPQDSVQLGSTPLSRPAFVPSRTVAPQLPDPHFKYAKTNPQDLTMSQAWWPGKTMASGTDANITINNDYDRLNKSMQSYLAGDPNGPKLPPVADWMTFGKYASREAGEQIRNLEDVMKASTGDVKAAADVARNGANEAAIVQAAMMGGDSLGRNAAAQNPVRAGFNPLGAVSDTLADTTGDMVNKLGKMRNALVEGNTEIHKNIAPAYDAYLAGEASGKGGMQALTDAGYTKGSQKDPQGFVSDAFANYKEARGLGLQAQRESDPVKKKALEDKRQAAMEKGNLMLGMQEQMEILQKKSIFGDKDMQQALGSIGGKMQLTDANGGHDLRPDGKNWTDFQTRMGLKSVPAGTKDAIAVRDHQGVTTHYVVDPSQKGTISEYFTQNAAGPNADNLNRSAPRPVRTTPTTLTGQAVDSVATNIQQGDIQGTVAAAAALPARAAGGVLADTGQTVQTGGQLLTGAGVNQIVQGANQGGFSGGFQMVQGATAVGAGTVVDLAGKGMNAVGTMAKMGGDALHWLSTW
jgi:hypothetical protein